MITKWIPTTNLLELRRFGKTGEECGELSAVVNRCIIQGIDSIDPASGKTNRQRLMEESADVSAQIICNINAGFIDMDEFDSRVNYKIEQMKQWEDLFANGR